MGKQRISRLKAKTGTHRSRNGNPTLRVDLHGMVHLHPRFVGTGTFELDHPKWGIPTIEGYCTKAKIVHTAPTDCAQARILRGSRKHQTRHLGVEAVPGKIG